MVKSDPPVTDKAKMSPVPRKAVAESPADLLRRAGEGLMKTRRLVQTHGIGPLQLHGTDQALDNILLTPGRQVAVLTDKQGQAALAYARARVHWQVTGWLPDTRSWLDLQRVSLPDNLVFDKQPQTRPRADEQPQAILAVAWAHKIFSEAQYNITPLVQAVQGLLTLLPDNGQLLIQDFALPEDPDRFVVLELTDDEAIQALTDFSETARPYAPKALRGFFIEPLPFERPGSQRFRLPLKWATEFYHRWRMGIAVDAPFELTTLTLSQWVALIEQCGARATYRAPHFPRRQERDKTQAALRFFDEHDQPMPLPAGSFTLLVEKIPDSESVYLYERRVSGDKAQDITISSLRSSKSEQVFDLVEITRHEDDVLPWYRDADGRLHVLVCTNVARPIINSVPRGTANLDGRQWAGYLVEPLTVPHLPGAMVPDQVREAAAEALALPLDMLGQPNEGITYYPAPDYLLQRVRGLLLPVHPGDAPLPERQTAQGRVIDVLADDVLRAISGGLIPDGKLEILIGKLMLDLGIKDAAPPAAFEGFEKQAKTIFVKDRREAKMPRIVKSGEHLMDYIADKPTENLRAVRSVFAEDQINAAGRQIARYDEQDFIVASRHSSNTAVVVPFSRDPVGALMLSAEPRRLPVPARLGHTDDILHLPSFSLPGTVRTLEQAKLFLAEQLAVNVNELHVLGPSFFAQPQLSYERVYPFLLYSPARATTMMRWFKPRWRLQTMVTPPVEKTEAYIAFTATRNLGEFYRGFGPDMTQDLTAKAKREAKPAAPAPVADKPAAPKPQA